MKRVVGVFTVCLCLIIASCKSPTSPKTKKANLVLDGDLVTVMTSYGCPEFDGAVKNTGNNTAWNCMVSINCYSDEAKTTIIDTAVGFPAYGGEIPAGVRAIFSALILKCTSLEKIKATTINITWLDR